MHTWGKDKERGLALPAALELNPNAFFLFSAGCCKRWDKASPWVKTTTSHETYQTGRGRVNGQMQSQELYYLEYKPIGRLPSE